MRQYAGWYRRITLALLTHIFLQVVKQQALEQGKWDLYRSDERLIPITVPEVRRLLTRLVRTENKSPDFILYWSGRRRRHQPRVQQYHYKRRPSNLRL